MRFSSDFSCQRRCSFAVALIYKRVGQANAMKLGEGGVGQFVLFIVGVCVEISVCKMHGKPFLSLTKEKNDRRSD